MESRLKRYAGVGGMIIGSLLTMDAVQESNLMFMWETILITIAGACYAFPVKAVVKRFLEAHKTKAVDVMGE